MKRIFVMLLLALFPMIGNGGLVPKPVFADPNYNGSCDPEVVWNEHAKEW